jgi:hypothetical protein
MFQPRRKADEATIRWLTRLEEYLVPDSRSSGTARNRQDTSDKNVCRLPSLVRCIATRHATDCLTALLESSSVGILAQRSLIANQVPFLFHCTCTNNHIKGDCINEKSCPPIPLTAKRSAVARVPLEVE